MCTATKCEEMLNILGLSVGVPGRFFSSFPRQLVSNQILDLGVMSTTQTNIRPASYLPSYAAHTHTYPRIDVSCVCRGSKIMHHRRELDVEPKDVEGRC